MTDLFEGPAVHQAPPSRHARSGGRDRRAAKRRKQRQRRAAIIVVIVLVLVGGAGYFLAKNLGGLFESDEPAPQAQDYPGPGGDPVDVTINPGDTGAAMGQTLAAAGVVKSADAFVQAFELNPGAPGIQPGTHELLAEMRASDAVARLVANDNRVDTKVTIPEGYTVTQIIERAVSVTGFPKADFDAALADPATAGLPAEANGNFEGWLFPTTYVLDATDTAATMIQKMVAQTLLELDDLGVAPADRETVLIKASLIEREAKADADRPKMAQAIQNRLDTGMTLGIDAAVAYGAGKPGTELTKADLANMDNPYNLRKIKGLPPTPIASPGKPSVDAVLHPEPGPWVYWVTVNLDTGETKFAETYGEQQDNEAELDQWLAENGG